mgnify:CR=1 FL=1
MAISFPTFESMEPLSAWKVLRQMLVLMAQGRSNATGTVTLAPSATSTVIPDTRIAADSVILLQPTTANAAAALATTYVQNANRTNGQVTVTHVSNSQTDRTFKYLISG